MNDINIEDFHKEMEDDSDGEGEDAYLALKASWNTLTWNEKVFERMIFGRYNDFIPLWMRS